MHRRTWQRSEEKVATLVGGQRHPTDGKGDQPDASSDGWAFEVKSKGTFPGWLRSALAQAKKAGGKGRRPAVVLHEANTVHQVSDLVVVSMPLFLELKAALAEKERKPCSD